MGQGGGIGLLAAGAVLHWAVLVDVPYVDKDALGVVLMIVGLVTIAVSLVMNVQQSRTRNVVEYRNR